MLLPFVFLPLATVLINDVKAEPSSGAVTVEIATSDPVAISDVRVASGGSHRLYVYLDGSAAKRATFGGSAETIVVHPRLRYTKLEVPTSSRCGEPVGVVRTASGVRVRATCRGGAAGATVAPPVQVQAGANVDRPLPDAPGVALAKDKPASLALRAALTLPPEAAADLQAAEIVPREGPARPNPAAETGADEGPGTAPAAKGGVAAKAEVQAAALRKAEVPDAQATAGVQEVSSSPGKDSAGSPKSGYGAAATVLGAMLLLGVGVILARFARQRITRGRMIHIVETASIGPRRSLVVACVGGRTMVLGVSEGGVSLLDSHMPSAPPIAASEPELAGPAEDAGPRNLAFTAGLAQDSGPESPKHESSLLGRLFHRREPRPDGLESAGFDRLFSESLEDEDLRRKLSLGETGRVA